MYANFECIASRKWNLTQLRFDTLGKVLLEKTKISGNNEDIKNFWNNPFVPIANQKGTEKYILNFFNSPNEICKITLDEKSIEVGGFGSASLEINVGERQSVDLLIDLKNYNIDSLLNLNICVNLSANAKLNLYRLNQINGAGIIDWSFIQKENSRLNVIDLTGKSNWLRINNHVELGGKGAMANYRVGYSNAGTGYTDSRIRFEHLVPQTESYILAKGILRDSAQSVFSGQVYISQYAQKTSAAVLNKNLLLSPKAQAFSRPDLKIFADDVKASHGATVGQLRPEEIFYMTSRGIDLHEAKKLLQKAFLAEIFSNIPGDLLRLEFEKKLLAEISESVM